MPIPLAVLLICPSTAFLKLTRRRDESRDPFFLKFSFFVLGVFGHFVSVICPTNERISTRSRRHVAREPVLLNWG